MSPNIQDTVTMENAEFYISFIGPASRFPLLSRFFDRLIEIKATMEQVPTEDTSLDAILRDQTWVDLLDSAAFDNATGSDSWELEDIVSSILNGEYRLISITFDVHSGRLVYDPWAYPFGGTDPLKALVGMFGFEVTRDSFWDGFAKSQKSAAEGKLDAST